MTFLNTIKPRLKQKNNNKRNNRISIKYEKKTIEMAIMNWIEDVARQNAD